MSRLPPRRERKAIFVPSGDQVAPKSENALKVSCVFPEPSEAITQISPPGPRPPRVQAIFVPSGDQAGNTSTILSFVRVTVFDPSGRLTQMATCPPRSLSKAIKLSAPFAPVGGAATGGTAAKPSIV